MSSPFLILFDCDGTLVDSHGAIVHAMQAAFEASGEPAPDAHAVHGVIGLSLTEAVRRLADGRDELVAPIAAAYRDFYVAGEEQLELFPGVRETIAELKARGYWLGIVTGKSRPGLLRVLEQFGMREDFLTLRTADCCPSKPHPAMTLECMQEMGVEASRTAVIGDAGFDMQMARAAGVRALGVSFGVSARDHLLAEGAEHVVDRFGELLAWFPALQESPALTTMEN